MALFFISFSPSSVLLLYNFSFHQLVSTFVLFYNHFNKLFRHGTVLLNTYFMRCFPFSLMLYFDLAIRESFCCLLHEGWLHWVLSLCS